MNDKVWVLRCTEPPCEWTHMVPRQAETRHRKATIDRHRAEEHRLLPEFLTTAIETTGVRVICLRGTHRDAIDVMDEHVELLVLAGWRDLVSVRRASLRIDFQNASRALYMGGEEWRLEEKLRGHRAVYIDGVNHAYRASQHVLAPGGA